MWLDGRRFSSLLHFEVSILEVGKFSNDMIIHHIQVTKMCASIPVK